jgi:cyanate permease
MHTRRYSIAVVFLIALIGLTGLSEALERLLPIHFPIADIVQLVGVGVCFGIALSVLYSHLRGPSEP